MNLAYLKNSVTAKIGLDSTSGSTEDTLMTNWANEAVLDVLLKTHCYVAVETITLTAGVYDYRMNSGILAITDIFITGGAGQWRFDRLSAEDILRLRAGVGGGSPARYYAVNGSDLLMLWPTPDSADVITIYYVPRPANQLADPTDDPSSSVYGGIPSEYHKALEYYMLWQAAEKDTQAPSGYRTLGMGHPQKALYDEEINEIRKAIRNKGGRRLSRSRVGGRWPFAPHDRSVYPQ